MDPDARRKPSPAQKYQQSTLQIFSPKNNVANPTEVMKNVRNNLQLLCKDLEGDKVMKPPVYKLKKQTHSKPNDTA